MLTLTPEAVQAVDSILHSDAVPEAAGLRIAATQDASQLSVQIAEGPAPGDQIIEERGARVFVDEQVAPIVDDATLHADNQDGRIAFGLAAQQP
jgi:Fe-S cluster assembly iron-binding protein IscA